MNMVSSIKSPFLYTQTATATVVAGNMLVTESVSSADIQAFINAQLLRGKATYFFGLDEDLVGACPLCYKHALIGAEPLWNLVHWRERQMRNKTVRNSSQAALCRGCVVYEIDTKDEHCIGEVLQQCENVRQQWLHSKHLPPLHFVAETVLYLEKKHLFVVQWNNVIVAYAVVCIVGSGVDAVYRVEHFIRLPDAPQGSLELLLLTLGEALLLKGASKLSLSLAPFSQQALSRLPKEQRSLSMERLLRVIHVCGAYWYNAKGLERFKTKFLPDEWKPLYCSFPSNDSSVKVLATLAEAFFGKSVWYGLAETFQKTLRNLTVASR